jgi:hypothetical protein
MEAEVVRDSLLHVAGQLDLTMGGPDLDHESGLTVPRRSVYFRHASEKQMTLLVLFDTASVSECYRRGESIAPQQALALVNSSLALAQARTLAGRLWKEVQAGGAPDANPDEAFVRAAFDQLLCRQASNAECSECLAFLKAQAAALENPGRLSRFDSTEKNAVAPAADPRQRARENLVHVLLNHNDFVTIR